MPVLEIWKWALGVVGIIAMTLGTVVLKGMHGRVKTLEHHEHENTGQLASLATGQEAIQRGMERMDGKLDRLNERLIERIQ